MFNAIATTTIALEEHLAGTSDQRVALSFEKSAGERPFTETDAVLAHTLANLPERGRLPVAVIAGALSGADLALALTCPVIQIERGARLSTGFGRPGSAAIYVSAARHVGAAACERLLFGPAALSADEAAQAHLASVVESARDAPPLPAQRLATMIAVAKANLVTWPVTLAKTLALVDGALSRGH